VGAVGIVVAAIVGAFAGLTVRPVADAIATRRYGPDSEGHDPEDMALALATAPTSPRAAALATASTSVAFALLAGEFRDVEVWAFFAALTWLYVVAALIDLQYLRLPDVLTVPAAAIAIAGSAALAAHFHQADAALPGAVAAVATAGFLWLVSELFRMVRRADAFGLGDVKLEISLGASVGWLGWTQDTGAFGPIALVVWAAMAGFLVGSVAGLPAARFKVSKHIPFGPFLMLGWFVVVLFADSLRP